MVLMPPRSSRCIRTTTLSVVLCLSAWTVSAQIPADPQLPSTENAGPTRTPFDILSPSRPERPYRGIFGLPQSNLEPRLTLELSIGGGMSGDPVAAQGLGTPGGASLLANESGAENVSVNLDYSWSKPGIGVSASNRSLADYYPQQAGHKFLPRDYSNGAFYFVPAQGTRVTISETFKNLPEFSFSDLHEEDLGDILPVNQGLQLTLDRYTRVGTAIDVSQALSSRSTLEGNVSYARGMVPTHAWNILLASGLFRHRITEGFALYGGYEYGGQADVRLIVEGIEQPLKPRDTRPRLNVGVDFSRALSFSRRTTFSFSTGTAGTHDSSDSSTTYHFVGKGRLNREIGRTWNAGLVVGREVRYIEVLSQPLFTDSLAVTLSGSLSRRVELKSALSASTGHLGAAVNNFDSYVGSVQLSVALTRHLALGADYAYAKLSSAPGALPIDASRQLSQQSARGYVKVWMPLVSVPKRQ